ncbi:hypothetical protein DBV15_00944 [Temnothorax longispinosus]|uniref:Uncharacterized protein n=1 Tax=Temnothorax longispinosus TaxID=300112 RepID=A0A4S2JE14_9HYME|nr:hypothetical protein DBV15_00944 [Temnothorax longispinosus]
MRGSKKERERPPERPPRSIKMSGLPSDGRKLGDGQGQLFILLGATTMGFASSIATPVCNATWSKCPCFISLGAFSSRREATVRHCSRTDTETLGNYKHAMPGRKATREKEGDGEKERERGWYSQKKCTAANHEVSAAAGCH